MGALLRKKGWLGSGGWLEWVRVAFRFRNKQQVKDGAPALSFFVSHSLHYLYTSDGGSVKLWQVTPNPLSQGIELSYSDTAVVYPVELVFYGFREKPLWSYFRLITTATEPIGVLPREVLNATVPSFCEFAYRTPIMHYSASKGEGGPTKEERGSKE